MATPWDQVMQAEYAKYGWKPDAGGAAYWQTNQNPDALRAALAADAEKAKAGAITPSSTYGLGDIANKYNAQGQPMTGADADFWGNYLNQAGNDWNTTSAAMDNAFIYDRAKATPVQQPGQQQNNQFMDILDKMMQSFGQQQQGYQQSVSSLMQSWADMAKPPTPAAGTPDPSNPYGTGSGVSGTKDGIGQASAVYNPMGQNGLNFGWAANNPFGATF